MKTMNYCRNRQDDAYNKKTHTHSELSRQSELACTLTLIIHCTLIYSSFCFGEALQNYLVLEFYVVWYPATRIQLSKMMFLQFCDATPYTHICTHTKHSRAIFVVFLLLLLYHRVIFLTNALMQRGVREPTTNICKLTQFGECVLRQRTTNRNESMKLQVADFTFSNTRTIFHCCLSIRVTTAILVYLFCCSHGSHNSQQGI